MLRGTSAPAVREATRLPTDFRWHLFFGGGEAGILSRTRGKQDPVCRLRRPWAGHSRLRGCTEWLWHLLEVGPHRTTAPVVVPGASGGRLGPPTGLQVRRSLFECS